MAGQGSARVNLKEIDLSQVRNPQQSPQGVPAAVVGPAKKGPAFVPKTFANMQQFSEVFGDMIERSKESNSNLFGPLALDQWLNNANSGTFVRTLGVGDGSKNATDAGFVVGERPILDSTNKVGDNPHATNDSGPTLGRTHILGCFMKDESDSKLLRDAGIETSDAGGKVTIRLNSPNNDASANPVDGDTITLIYLLANGTTVTKVFEFESGGGVSGTNISVTIGANLNATATDLALKINDNSQSRLTAVREGGATNAAQKIVVSQVSQGELTNTEIKYNVNPTTPANFTVGGKIASNASQTFSYAQTGATAAKCDITISNNPAKNETLSLTAVRNDGDGTLASANGTEKVIYKFVGDSTIAAGNGSSTDPTDGVGNRYTVVDANNVTIYSGGTIKQTLLNLKAAIDRTSTAVHTLVNKGLLSTSLSVNGLTLTVTQVNKGKAGNSKANSDPNIEYSDDGNNGLSISCASNINGTAAVIGRNATGHFIGGADGSSASFTMKLSGNLNLNDIIEISNNKVANSTTFGNDTEESETFIITNTGNNGATDGGDNIRVRQGVDLQETLYNLRSAILAGNETSLLETQATATLRAAVGDAAHGLTAGQKITLKSTDGTLVDYFVSDTNGGGAAHLSQVSQGTVLKTAGNITATLTANATGIAVGFNLTAGTQHAFLVLLKAAIEHANGHGGKIIVGAVPAEANATIDVVLTQLTPGSDGNTTSSEDLANITVQSDFANGENGLNASKITVSDANDSIQFVQDQNISLKTELENILKVSENATFSNPAGATLTGNFGEKLVSFSGGGGGASPVIRGILMVPQGVVPSLDVQHTDNDFNPISAYSSAESVIKTINVNNKQFSDASQDNGVLAGYQVGKVDLGDQSFKLILNGLSNESEPAIINCSFNPGSKNYFAKVLNTDPAKINERGHFLYANWDLSDKSAKASNVGIINNDGGQLSSVTNENSLVGFLLRTTDRNSGSRNLEGFNQRFQTAKTPWFVSQYFSSGGNTSRQSGGSGLVLSTGGAKKLFRLHALDDGAIGNNQFRVLISGLRSGNKGKYGSFNLSLELFDGDAVSGDIVFSWNNLSLDPESPNFVARVIGDQHMYYNFDADSNRQRLILDGIYPVRNNYVRVELAQELLDGDVNVEALPVGFRGPRRLDTSSLFSELGDNGSGQNRVLSNTAFNDVKVSPLPFVKSLSRLLPNTTDVYEIDDSLSWGIKFAKREKGDQTFNENSELTFNESLKSWTLYFPDGVCDEDSGTADAFQNNFFSLEKIAVKVVSGEIDWDSAKYSRDGSLPSDYSRFVDASTDLTTLNSRYLKLRSLFQGGFDGLNIFNEEKALQTNTATHREAQDERNDGSTTGSTILGYRKALDVLTDKSAVEFQLLAVPGIREPQVTDYAVKACEDRFDAMFLMDIEEVERSGEVKLSSLVQAHVRKTVSRFEARNLDTSFAAAYFPDVLIRKPSTGGLLAVPPSVVMLGAMSRNDLLADPWFAPAGLNRGRLAALNSNLQMNRDLLDELYDADINPIYEPAGRPGEVYAFGQKTLLRDQSALDRINVRRLLIDIRRKVKGVAESLLFEPNRASTLQRFSALVEPIMQNVQQRQGVERYKVQIDTATTTQNDIENNTIRGKVYLQPTKSVEFISLDFVVTNSINQ